MSAERKVAKLDISSTTQVLLVGGITFTLIFAAFVTEARRSMPASGGWYSDRDNGARMFYKTPTFYSPRELYVDAFNPLTGNSVTVSRARETGVRFLLMEAFDANSMDVLQAHLRNVCAITDEGPLVVGQYGGLSRNLDVRDSSCIGILPKDSVS